MLINPITFLKRVKTAEKSAEKLIINGLKSQKLEIVNQDNLLNGRNSEGNDMPSYSTTFMNGSYGNMKSQMNPKNRGRWDLKLKGAYHKGIYTIIQKKTIIFKQRLRNKKVNWINSRIGNSALGITEEQMIDAQKKNIPIVKPKILKIINGS